MKLHIVTPLYNGQVHWLYLKGLMQTCAKFGTDDVLVSSRQGSFLPKLRDLLTQDFLVMGADYMLCIDADIGFTADDVEKLLKHDRPFISGVYSRKQFAKPGSPNTSVNLDGHEHENGLRTAFAVGAGFLLVSRATVRRMVDANQKLIYTYDGSEGGEQICGLWSAFKLKNTMLAEDHSFCMRWRALGGEIFVDPSVKLAHAGEHVYTLPIDGNESA